jgi:large subunit ribosomal protein L7/L12
MRAVVLIVVAVAAAGLLLLVVARRSGRGRDLVGSQLAATRPAPRGLDDAELRRQIEALLRDRGKIHAIKLLRDQRPMSLRDAKTEVERIEAGLGFGTAAATPPRGYGIVPAGVSPEVLAEVRELKSRNQLIHAIKVMREHTGMGLRDAKDAVDRL